MGTLNFFDPEHVERPVPDRPWIALALVALAATATLTAGWEIYWRGKSFDPGDIGNSSALWAQERRKAQGEATVLIGSSRILFGLDVDVWDRVAGVKPIQLALEGTSPRIFLKDLASDEEFRGLVIIGVTAPLFFTQEGGRRDEVLKYTRDQSPSQRVDHLLSMSLEDIFAFLDEQTRPKRQIQIASLPLRDGMRMRSDPRKLSVSTRNRNTEMWRRVVEDEAYQEEAEEQWALLLKRLAPPPGPDGRPQEMPDEAIAATIAAVKADVDRIRARGGDVAFVRFPYGGAFTPAEDFGFPRERFWDPLIARTQSAGVSWHDHAVLQGYELPEWSHLDPRDAEKFTEDLAPILLAEIEAARARRRDAPIVD